MFGDLVRVELFVWPTTSFDPLFANFKFGQKALGREKGHQRRFVQPVEC